VLLAGDVDHDTCLALMSASDVFIRPTLEDGDSISVREALELKVPVVASRVGTRPPGAILFHPGDVEDLLSKLECALAQRRQAA
jgi:glycosyltransferase involved in cell wall biosynthesis